MSQICLFFFVLQLCLETRAYNKEYTAVRRERKLSTSPVCTYSSFTQRSRDLAKAAPFVTTLCLCQLLMTHQATSLACFAYWNWAELSVTGKLHWPSSNISSHSTHGAGLSLAWTITELSYNVVSTLPSSNFWQMREEQQNGISFPSISVAFPLPRKKRFPSPVCNLI